MNRHNPLWMSFASGCVWAMVGLAVAFVGYLPYVSAGKVIVPFVGGVMAAPFIGLIMGQISRLFGHVGPAMRIIVTALSLYAAAVLFLMASLEFASFVYGRPPRHFWTDSFAGAFAGLVWTGSVVVLGPFAYANHAWISRAWERWGCEAGRRHTVRG
jgi:hypothetical protein